MGVEAFVDELNRLYEFDIDKYVKECDDLKRMGYKIYRNSEGRHRIVEPGYRKKSNTNTFPEGFGDIFNSIFGNIK